MTYKNLLLLFLVLLQINLSAQTITDIDGNIYPTITIGSQTWMQENLKTTHFNNGIAIPTTTAATMVDSTSLFQWAYNNDSNNINDYGRLYTWFTVVNSNQLCPTGWHVPDQTEWQTLSSFLGGETLAGSKMKETGTVHWSVTDSSVDNSSFFTGLPGGMRGNPMGFGNLGSYGNFWSSTPLGTISSFQRGICFNLQATNSQFLESVAVANCGMSVRCIKNSSTSKENIGMENEIQVFPNPSLSHIFIQFESPVLSTLYMYSIEGKLMLQKSLTEKLNIIEIENLERGLYFLKIVGEGFEVERKFVKE